MSRDDDRETVLEVLPSGSYDEWRKQQEEEKTLAEKQTEDLFKELNGVFQQKVGSLALYRETEAIELEFLEKFASDKYADEESLFLYVKNTYGAGEYRVHGRIPGKKGIALNKRLTIGKTLADIKNEKEKNTGLMTLPQDGNDRLMYMIMEQGRRQEQLIKSLTERKSSALDFLKNPETMALLIPAVTALATSFMENRKTADPIGQLVKLMELKKMMEPEKKEEEEKTTGVIGTLTEVAAGVLTNLQSKKMNPTHTPVIHQPPTAVADTVRRNQEERESMSGNELEKWGPEDVAEFLESVAESDDLEAEGTADNVRDQLLANAELSSILEGVVFVNPKAYEKIKPIAIKKLQMPQELINRIEAARKEEWSNDEHSGAETG